MDLKERPFIIEVGSPYRPLGKVICELYGIDPDDCYRVVYGTYVWFWMYELPRRIVRADPPHDYCTDTCGCHIAYYLERRDADDIAPVAGSST
jgi:hypothetical protein